MNKPVNDCVVRMSALCCVLLAELSHAQPAPEPAPDIAPAVTESTPSSSWEIQSVRELMQADLQQALQSAGARQVVDQRPPGVTAQPILGPKLVALYGVGKALMAEVQVGQRAYLYVRGQAYPAGYAGDASVYRLRGMNGACVQLEKGQDRHSLCLRMLLSGGQP